MTENTGVHPGQTAFGNLRSGAMTVDDEREMTQLFFDIIGQE
jgi:hypothetical protein